MIRKVSKLFFTLFILLIGSVFVFAQNQNDLPEALKESLAKRKLAIIEKEHEDLIKRGEEAAKLSEEISKSFEENQKLSNEDQKKLEKLEKVVKKIRRDLGAEDDNQKDENDNKPSTVLNTIKSIREKTSDLLSELKKASRYSISVIAVESSNSIFRMIKFLKFNKN